MKEQILLGSLLGDTSLTKRGNSYNLNIEHSLAQKEYSDWKKEKLDLCDNTYFRNRYDKRTGKTYNSCTIYKTSKNYKEYYDMFYIPKKEVSDLVLSKLTDLSVAIWYCDDGWYYQNDKYWTHQIGIATNSFSLESIDRIIKWFKSKYNLDFKIVANKSIRITSKKQCEQFLNIFGSYIPECMKYKKKGK